MIPPSLHARSLDYQFKLAISPFGSSAPFLPAIPPVNIISEGDFLLT
jgi:hypothetical protein